LSGGVAALTVALPAGTHTIAATYASTNNYDGGTATMTQVVRVPGALHATLSLTPSPNPSQPGPAITAIFRAVPLIAGAPTPAGTVACSIALHDPLPFSLSGGVAAFAVGLPAGSHTIAAAYASTNNYEGGTVTLTQVVRVPGALQATFSLT